MKRIESADLMHMGASTKALALYNETDPLRITENLDGTYSMTGCYTGVFETAEALLRELDELADIEPVEL